MGDLKVTGGRVTRFRISLRELDHAVWRRARST